MEVGAPNMEERSRARTEVEGLGTLGMEVRVVVRNTRERLWCRKRIQK